MGDGNQETTRTGKQGMTAAAEARSTAAASIAMRGAGYYSSHTIGAKAVIDAATDLVLEAARAVALPDPETPFGIADYGCADGGTSIDLHRALIADIRARAPGRPVSLVYTDLPGNDYSALFKRLQGLLPMDPVGLSNVGQLFTSASGTSFYRQIVPSGTLSLGFSATAMHWLSTLPGRITGHVHSVGAAGDELEDFRAQSLKDWETILLARAAELRPGGWLVLANFCIDEEGRYLGNTGGKSMFDQYEKHWRGLFDAGAITRAEYDRATFQQHYRTPAECAAPFYDPTSAVSRAGLELVRSFTRVTPCPYAADFARQGDAAAFAKAYIPTLRSWSESTFAGALDPARPPAERAALVDRFYDSYEADVARDPVGHGMDYVHCFMQIRKRG
jgi:hypothetical protein